MIPTIGNIQLPRKIVILPSVSLSNTAPEHLYTEHNINFVRTNRFGKPVDIGVQVCPEDVRLTFRTFHLRRLSIESIDKLPISTKWTALPSRKVDDFALFDPPLAFSIFAYLVQALRLPNVIDNLSQASRRKGECIIIRGPHGSKKVNLCFILVQNLAIRFGHLYRAFQVVELDARQLVDKRDEQAAKNIGDLFLVMDKMIQKCNSVMYFVLVKDIDVLNYGPLVHLFKGTKWISERGNVIVICTACEELSEDHIKGLYSNHGQWQIKAPTTEKVYGYFRELYFCLPGRYQIVTLPNSPVEGGLASNVPKPHTPGADVPDSNLPIGDVPSEEVLSPEVQSPVAPVPCVPSEGVPSLEMPHPNVPVSKNLTPNERLKRFTLTSQTEGDEFPVWKPSWDDLPRDCPLAESNVILRLVIVAEKVKEFNWREIEDMIKLSRKYMKDPCSINRFVKVLKRGVTWLDMRRLGVIPPLAQLQSWLEGIELEDPLGDEREVPK